MTIDSAVSKYLTMASTSLYPARNALRCLSKSQLRTHSSLVTPQTSPFAPRHLLSIADLSAEEFTTLVRNARSHKVAIKSGTTPKNLLGSLTGKTVAMMFNKRSTRTRISTEAAVTTLGGHPMFLGKDDIQLGVSQSTNQFVFTAIDFS